MKLSEMFENHMVFQRGMPVPVWGEAASGETVTVSIAGQVASTIAIDGRFRLTLPALPTGGPYTLIAETAQQRIELTDVQVGEVWLCAGQSNMEMPLFCASSARPLIEATQFPDIRLKTISRKSRETAFQYGFHFAPESSEPSPWQVADGRSAALFSAIGYAFGKALLESRAVPIGIISGNWGGTKVQPWVSPETLNSEPVFQGDREAFEALRAKLGPDGERQRVVYEEAIQQMLVSQDTAELIGLSLDDPLHYWKLDAALPWPEDGAPGDPNEPGCLYTHMLRRVFPLAMRGVLWYQGESSAQAEDMDRYEDELRAMIKDWRSADENDRLPFLLVQLAPYDTTRRAFPCDWMKIREQQRTLSQTCPNVFLCCIPDLGEAKNIHPIYKIEVGERLCALARETIYGEDICGQGPVAEAAVMTDDGVHISFTHAKGLRMALPLSIELSLDGERFFPADRVALLSTGLLCQCKAVQGPRWVRFAWSPMMDAGLWNEQGLPAGPFCIEIRHN